MTAPPATDDLKPRARVLQALRKLAEANGLSEPSMGTSQDYAVAAEEGATLVRVGAVLWQG